MKNLLLRLGVKLFPKRAETPSPERILLVSTTALGDTVWALPILDALKTALPTSKIHFLTSSLGEEVLRFHPAIDQIYRLPLWKHWPSLRSAKFDTVCILHASQRIVFVLAASLGAGRVISTAGRNKGLDSLMTHLCPDMKQHEVERRFCLVDQITPLLRDSTPRLFLQPDEIAYGERLAFGRRPLIVLHPGAQDGFKRWPPEHFIALGKLLKNYSLTVTGSRTESPLVESIAKAIGATPLSGFPSVRHFAAYLRSADLLISNDTGPLHLASAVGAPFLGLFGPTSPEECAPWRPQKGEVIAVSPTCKPCLRKKCGDPFCLRQLSPQAVFDQAVRALTVR